MAALLSSWQDCQSESDKVTEAVLVTKLGDHLVPAETEVHIASVIGESRTASGAAAGRSPVAPGGDVCASPT